jgi:hypothetical protein
MAEIINEFIYDPKHIDLYENHIQYFESIIDKEEEIELHSDDSEEAYDEYESDESESSEDENTISHEF